MKKLILMAATAAILSSGVAQASCFEICIHINGQEVCWCCLGTKSTPNLPSAFNEMLIKQRLVDPSLINPGGQSELIRPNR